MPRVPLPFTSIARGGTWLLGERVVIFIVGMAVSVVTIRYLEAELYGKLSYAVSMVGIFAAIANLGLDQPLVRRLAQAPATSHSALLSTTAVLRTLAGLPCAGLAIACAALLTNDPVIVALTTLTSLSQVFGGLAVPELWFRATVQQGAPVIARTLGLFVSSAARVTLAWVGASVVMFALTPVLASVVTGCVLLFALKRHQVSVAVRSASAQLAGNLVREAWPLILSGLSVAVYMQIDQVMLGSLSSTEEIGLYATAVRLSEAWYFLPVMLARLLLPVLARAKVDNEQEYDKCNQLLLDVSAGLAYSVAIAVTLVAQPVVVLLFGASFEQSAGILQVHIWAFPFVALGIARSQWLVVEKLHRFSLASTALGAVCNVLLNLVFIPQYGAMAAAWTTLASYAIAGYLSSLFFSRTHHVFWGASRALLLPIRLAAAVRNYRTVRAFMS